MPFDKSPAYESLPYRPCAGIALFNRAGLIFVGRRKGGVEHVDATHVWQMPQGGIDEGEDPYAGALRELYEETNVSTVERLGEIADWIAYDIPRDIVGEAWGGKYRGQKQKWFALRFAGDDSEIDIATPGGGQHKPEFIDWRWVELKSLPDLVVPFKRQTYEQVVAAFAPFAAG
ncbi:MAG: RNA pyrophosphohydrolase [Rhodopseudomonas sp.]|nr:RNA pyrophosphohydrolase [Rhodopseudomonas sp.]